MKISKTLFKNLSRCVSFSAYYDMYLNRFLHEVKEIDGKPVNKSIVEEVVDLNLEDDLFQNEENEDMMSIFSEMFDDDTGEDLTIFTNAQMEAFKDTFTEVERLASIYIEKLIGKKVIASTDTYSQKKYSYRINGNDFYCYLDDKIIDHGHGAAADFLIDYFEKYSEKLSEQFPSETSNTLLFKLEREFDNKVLCKYEEISVRARNNDVVQLPKQATIAKLNETDIEICLA